MVVLAEKAVVCEEVGGTVVVVVVVETVVVVVDSVTEGVEDDSVMVEVVNQEHPETKKRTNADRTKKMTLLLMEPSVYKWN